MNHRYPLSPAVSFSIAAFVAMSATLPQPALAQSAPSASDGVTLDKVVITAEKRLTVLDKTPEAISAISGAALAEMGAVGIQDIVGLVPNASFTTFYGQSKVNVRGIGLNASAGDPGVASYVDGSYVSDQFSVNTGLFDLQRVEVLRGPQGALYGRNATGGAVNFVSALPTKTFQGQASALIGDYGRRETDGFVSGPLGGSNTTARLSFKVKSLDGYASNTIAGNSYASVFPGNVSTVAPGRLDDLKTEALRLQTSSDFGDAGNLRLIIGYHKEDDNGPHIATLPQPVMSTVYLFGVLPIADRLSGASNGQSNKVDANSLQAIYERPIGTNTLTATASYRKSKSALLVDIDGSTALQGSLTLATDNADKSVDVHLASDESSRLQWMIGATYVDFDMKSDSNFQQKLSLGLLTGIPARNAIPAPTNTIYGGDQSTKSTAVYADLRYAFTPTLAVRGGLRTNRDQKDVSEYQTTATGTRRATPSASWSSTPGNIGLEWNATKDTLVYGKVSHGFKAGAINMGLLQANPVKPETVTSLEAGAKTSFLDNRGAFSAALFSSDYKDMQFSQITTLSSALINAPGAKINGLELELLVRPVSALTLGANLGLMDPTFSQFSNVNSRNVPAGNVNLNGKQIANVSRTQANLSADWSQSMGGYKASFRADYVWRDKFYFTEFNDPDVMQAAYGVLNLSASIRPLGGKWKFYAQVRNATNTNAYTSMTVGGIPNAGYRSVTYTPPRNFGVGVQLDF